MWRLLLITASITIPFGAANAQRADTANACARTFAGAATEIDSLVLSVEPGYSMSTVDSSTIRSFAISVASLLELPRPVALPSVVNLTDTSVAAWAREPQQLPQGLMAEAMLALDRDSPQARLVQKSLDPGLDSALLAAMNAAVALGLPAAIREAARRAGQGAAFFVRLETRRPSTGSSGGAAAVTVAALRVPLVEITKLPRGRPGNPAPRYPKAAQELRVEGHVRLAFVVDESGAVVPGSVNLIGDARREFVQATTDALPRYRFFPAMAGSCPVASLITLPFSFRIAR